MVPLYVADALVCHPGLGGILVCREALVLGAALACGAGLVHGEVLVCTGLWHCTSTTPQSCIHI